MPSSESLRRVPPKSRFALIALALVVVSALLLKRGCGDEEPTSDASGSTTAGRPTTADDATRRRVRAQPSPVTGERADGREPLFVDGWPGTDVIVRRADGSPAADAVVYLHPAGTELCGPLDRVPNVRADAEGHARLVVPNAGRYDVGAFTDPPSAVLLPDVEFPRGSPLEVRLRDVAQLDFRAEGDVARAGNVTVALATSAHLSAFPGRREARYMRVELSSPLPARLLVPGGVALRVWGTPEVVVEPNEIVAPGVVTVRASGRVKRTVFFGFTGPPAPQDRPLRIELNVEVAGKEWSHTIDGRTLTPTTGIGSTFDVVPGPTIVRWSIGGAASGSATLDTTMAPADGFHVAIPIDNWDVFAADVGVRVLAREVPQATQVVATDGVTSVAATGESWVFVPEGSPIAAVGDLGNGRLLVSEAVAPQRGRTVDLVLVPAGAVDVRVAWPAALPRIWPLTVARADGAAIAWQPNGRIGRILSREASIDGTHAIIAPLPEGETELVFALAGREIGRTRVVVRAGETTAVDAPEISPPGRR